MKIIHSILFFAVLIFSIFSFISCEKEEGTGGMSSISGNIYNTDYSPGFSEIIDQYAIPDTDVYIIYGDDDTYSDKIETSHNGNFKFEYLREGKYTIFVYSKDSSHSSTSEIIPIKVNVELDRKENKNIGKINIIDELDYNDGSASISGKIYKINWNATYTDINEQYYSPDEDVFLVYGDDLSYFEKTKTRADGSYFFNNLISGDYRIYAFSEDVTQVSVSNTIEISKDTSIVKNNQNIILEDLIIAD